VTDLSIIMISYNTRALTLASLNSLFEQTEGLTFEVIVLDNHSSDGSAESIAQSFPQVKLIASGQNHGFAQGNNIAIRESKGEYILLLNPDTVVLDGAIQKLFAFARQYPDAKIWGGRTEFADRTLNPGSCWRRETFWHLFCSSVGLVRLFPNSPIFNPHSYGGWDRSTIRQVDVVTGCFFMIRRELWDALDGFSPEFFMYGEEVDLCLRAHKFGAKPMVTPAATIIHYGGASEKVRADKMVRSCRVKLLLMQRHWPVWQYYPGRLLFSLGLLNRVITLKALGLFKLGDDDEAANWAEVWRRRSEWLG